MSITPEMIQKLVDARTRMVILTKIGSEMHQDLTPFLNDPKDFDSRVVTTFDNGAESPDGMRDYIRSFYRRSISDRDRYIDPMFQDLLSYRQEFSIADLEKTEGSLDHLHEYYQKFCYSENLIKLNKDYFDSQYTPAQARAIAANQDLFSSSTPILTYLLNTNGFTATLNFNFEHETAYSKPNALLSAQSADFIYRQTIDTLEGRSTNNTFSLRFPEGTDKQIFFMAEGLEKGTLIHNSEKCQSAANVFDSIFNTPFGPASLQGKEQAKLGKDIFDMIIIDGKSARETFEKKYESEQNPIIREKMMKAEVINAITSGKNRFELATLQRDQNNRLSLVVNQIQPDLSMAQPTIQEDYSRVRRMFNWGPFKCQTREEKLQATLAADTNRESRHDHISSRFQKSIDGLMVREAQAAKTGAPATTLDPVDEAYFGKSGIPMGPDKAKDLNTFFSESRRSKGFSVLDSPSKRRDIADLVLLSQGYTLTQLLEDTPDMQEARANAGQTLVNALRDPDDEAGKKTLIKLFSDGTEKLLSSEFTVPDPSNPVAVAESRGMMQRLQDLSSTWMSASNSYLGTEIRASMDQDKRFENPSPSQFMRTLYTYTKAATTLDDYYQSPQASDPEADLGTPSEPNRLMRSGVIGKYVMDTFSAKVRSDTFNASSLRNHQLASLNEAMGDARENLLDTLNYEYLNSQLKGYLRGDSPCPMSQLKLLTPLQTRTSVSSRDLMAEERRPARSGPAPSREARSPESVRREPRERETEDKGFSR